ncbi:Vesicle-mediated transporter [Phytophthora megakarya]|uniref:Vesicle-mediated transporter n=1 Tax=Phytophthora megakarya TaxID=4795 RepID=A0A225WCA7_9STRA|nr:Vesicle-mediated transporter [Phytophthora megakarya]
MSNNYGTNGGIFAGDSSGVTGGGPDPTTHNNYSTFFAADSSVRSLMRTSDNIERTRRTVAESEEVAKNVLVDLELQRSQLHDMKGMVSETSSMTGQVRRLLQIIADRSYRKRVCLYMVIVALAITDMLVFYLLFVR